jgi:hypothetical protein
MLNLKKVGSNQTEVRGNGAVVLFSYETPVAAVIDGSRRVRTSTRWSKTTERHINGWLKGYKFETISQDQINSLLG